MATPGNETVLKITNAPADASSAGAHFCARRGNLKQNETASRNEAQHNFPRPFGRFFQHGLALCRKNEKYAANAAGYS